MKYIKVLSKRVYILERSFKKQCEEWAKREARKQAGRLLRPELKLNQGQ